MTLYPCRPCKITYVDSWHVDMTNSLAESFPPTTTLPSDITVVYSLAESFPPTTALPLDITVVYSLAESFPPTTTLPLDTTVVYSLLSLSLQPLHYLQT